jgi:hypothetical protein
MIKFNPFQNNVKVSGIWDDNIRESKPKGDFMTVQNLTTRQFKVTKRSKPDHLFCCSVIISAVSEDCARIKFASKSGSTVERMESVYFITVERVK